MAKPVFQARANETVFAERVTADTWASPRHILVGSRISGKCYFTDQRIVFIASGLIGVESASWEIEMKDIQSVKPSIILGLPLGIVPFPIGVLITMKDGGKYKLGILKRKKYIDWISQHIS